MNFFYKMAEIRFMLIPYSLAFIAILLTLIIVIDLIQKNRQKNRKIKVLENEITNLKEELQRQTYLKEKYENEIITSELSHGRTKKQKRPTESEILDCWGIILDLQRLVNESDEDFRKRLSEKLPGKVM